MIKEEFLSLKKHDRIKYVGSKPVADVFVEWGDSGKLASRNQHYYPIPKKMDSLTIYWVDNVAAHTSWRGSHIPNHLSATFYRWGSTVIDPAEWEIVERRGHIAAQTQYKLAKNYIPQVIERFQDELEGFLGDFQSRINNRLGDLTADKKLKLIMELSPEEKKWFGIITTEPAEAIKTLEKAFEEEA